ncbi:hypothetical protein RJT34_15448 [Clitoria ternatea]|uniref:Uncharacterized protein n=1 Tax=Clitoria ternatea TaxID=43366 RepID=A0AAN9J5S0_CLITE
MQLCKHLTTDYGCFCIYSFTFSINLSHELRFLFKKNHFPLLLPLNACKTKISVHTHTISYTFPSSTKPKEVKNPNTSLIYNTNQPSSNFRTTKHSLQKHRFLPPKRETQMPF